MNRKTRIAIIVEVKKREMPFMCILQEVLKKKGYDVKLIPFRSMCTWRLILFRPNIILINGLRHEYPYFINQVYIPKKLFKSKIACYYSEQVGYYNESIAKGYYNKVIFDNVDYHIAWGPHFAKDLKTLGVPQEKLWYIGSVQYDIDKYLKKSYESVKKELSEKYKLPYEKNWILYADNIIEEYQKTGLYDLRREETFAMVETVARSNNDCHIIFRHHPDAPNHERKLARKRFAQFENVSVISEGHIFDWTCGISALIIWVSTSSLQTMFMGKPVFGFITSDGKDQELYWHRDIFPTYKEANALSDAIRRALYGTENEEDVRYAKNREAYIKDWYFKKDGYSFDRLCRLMDIVKDSSFNPITCGLKYSWWNCIKILYYELRARVGDIVKGRDQEKNLSQKEVLSELGKYDTARFEDKQFCVEQSDSGAFFV